eukprot:6052679-Pleurochrysis_carterae.AAC.3
MGSHIGGGMKRKRTGTRKCGSEANTGKTNTSAKIRAHADEEVRRKGTTEENNKTDGAKQIAESRNTGQD